MPNTSYIEIWRRLLQPLSSKSIHHESLCRHFAKCLGTSSSQENAYVGNAGNAEACKILIIRESGKGGLDQLLSVGEIGILEGRHRITRFEDIDLLHHEHRLCASEV